MKLAVFWDVAPCNLVDVFDVLWALAASNIRPDEESSKDL
jgi:hypothetical protein